MRILIISQYFWPESFRINDVARDLVRRGHDVIVLCGTPNYPAGVVYPGYGWFLRTRERWNCVDIIRVPTIARGRGSRWQLAGNYVSYAISGSLLGLARCRGRFDAILVFQMSPVTMGIPGLVISTVLRAPMLFWVQDLWPESLIAVGAVRNKWLLRAIDSLVGFLYRASALVLIQSRSFRDHVESRGVHTDQVRYFPNSAESLYQPLPLEASHPALKSVPPGFRVMFAGNIGAAQDLPTVLRAAELTRELPDVQWVIVGDGSMRRWVESEVNRRGLGGTVHLLGRFPTEDMPAIFAGADALLVTLRKDPVLALTIPSKIQSYLATAKPIVGALDGEGAAVLAEAGAGVCGPSEDAPSLADHVLSLRALAPDARAEMGRRGRAYFVANFKAELLLEKLEAWFRECGPHVEKASR
jgi:colanic acid biosynthesis glycosyl transferase WcaI